MRAKVEDQFKEMVDEGMTDAQMVAVGLIALSESIMHAVDMFGTGDAVGLAVKEGLLSLAEAIERHD